MGSRLLRGWWTAAAFFAAMALWSAAEAQVVSSFQPGQGVFNESNKPLATVDPVMGVARATVPFLLNSARGAAQPELTLVYSSDAGDETAGRGWGLSLPSIERRPLSAPGLGIARDNRFVFSGQPIVPICTVKASKCSNPALGNESLPPWTVDGSPGSPWTYYRAQVEGAFMRLFLSSDWNTWRVEMKNGVTMEFGAPLTAPRAGATSIDGQLQANASPLAAAADGRFRWNLVRQFDSQVDTQGNPVNVVVYQWALFPRDDRQLGGVPGFGAAPLPTAGVPANGDLGLNYLTDVFDTPRPGVSLDNVGVYAHHAHLSYASNPVPDVSHALVWRATPSKPLSGIDVTSANFAGTGPRELARRYHLTYQTMLHSAFLTSVQLEGRCPGEVITEPLPAATNCPPMPATTFQYSQNTGANPPWPHPIAVQSLVPGEQVFSNIFNLGVMDINGDGLPDIVESWPGDVPATWGSNQPGVFVNSASDTLEVFVNTPQWGSPTLQGAAIFASAVVQEFVGQGSPGIGSGEQNTFLSSSGGVSIVGYWGNIVRFGVLFSLNPFPNNKGYALFYPFLDTLMSPPEWEWGSSYENLQSLPADLYLVADIDGDGLQDAVDTQNRLWFSVKDLSAGSNYNHLDPLNVSVTPNITVATQNLNLPPGIQPPPGIDNLADMNGDGLPDFVTTLYPGTPAEQYVYYPGDGTGAFNCIRPAGACQVPAPIGTGAFNCNGPAGACSVPAPIPAPQCGQCPPLPSATAAYVPLQFEESDFGPGFTRPPTLTQLALTGDRLFFRDIEGDGLADIIVIDYTGRGIRVWHNIDGIHFKAMNFPGSSGGTVPFLDVPLPSFSGGGIARATFADMDGNGTDGIVLIYPGGVQYIDFGLKLLKQGLLTGISNGLGVSTIITYRSTAELDGEAAGTSDAWSDHSAKLEFVVTALQTIVSLPLRDQTVTYAYQDPIYDAWQQAFLGFRRVRKTLVTEDPSIPNPTTQTTYFFGNCQPLSNTVQCPETSDDDDSKAVTGVPITSDVYDASGSHYSTTVWQYQSSVLFNGFKGDTRRVRFAYANKTDTWLYDAPNATATAQTVSVSVVQGAGDVTMANVPLAAPTDGRVHLRSDQTMDQWGNVVRSVDDGQVDDNGNAIDQPIVATATYATPAAHWVWETTGAKVAPFAPSAGTPPAEPRTYTFQYDPQGNLRNIAAALTGTVALDRFHENPSKTVAPAPSSASVDNANLQLAKLSYDQFGNRYLVQGPAGACDRIGYDAPYAQFPIHSSSYTGGCNIGALTTELTYDRGLSAVTSSVAPSSAQSSISYDNFGRISAVFEPDPNTGVASTTASIKVHYSVNSGEPTQLQLVNVEQLDGAHPISNSYHENWTYFDGSGTPILNLSQADPNAGDGGKWVASGLPFRDTAGAIIETFQPWFYGRDPQQYYPFSTPSTPSRRLIRDSLGRVTQILGPDLTTVLTRQDYHALSEDLWDAENVLPSSAHSGRIRTVLRDGHGRIVSFTRQLKTANGVDVLSTKMTYLATGELAVQSQSHSLGSETVSRSMQYDSLGRLVENVEPNTSVVVPAPISPSNFCDPQHPCKPQFQVRDWRYAYDDAGHLVGTSDARGCGENLYYDTVDRLLAEGYSPCRSYQADYSNPPNLTDGSYTDAFLHYDSPEPGQTTDFGPNARFLAGKLVAVSDHGAHTRLAWDGRGRLLGVARQIATPGVTPSSLSTRYGPWWFRYGNSYDPGDRIVAQSTGADVTDLMVQSVVRSKAGVLGTEYFSNITPSYSKRGVVTGLSSSYGPLIPSITYGADGGPIDYHYGDAAATDVHLTYDPLRRLQEFKVSRTAPSLWTQPIGQYVPPATGPPSTLQLTLEDLVFKYDGVSNPLSITDQRIVSQWPPGSDPVTRQLKYDDLYRLRSLTYQNETDVQVSAFAFEAASGDSSPVPMLALSKRVQTQLFSYDFLGDQISSSDDAQAFYDRSLGTVTNGIQNTPNANAGQVPNQLISAAGGTGQNLAAHYDAAGDLEDLSVERNGACSSPSGCTQRFAYEWDQVGQLSRARRWDYVNMPANAPVYPALPATPAARDLQYKYDAGGSRVLKSAADAAGNQLHSISIFDSLRLDQATWEAPSGNYERNAATEIVYLGGVARLFNSSQPLPSVDGANLHVFFVLGDPAGSTSAMVDRETGEVVESATYQGFGGAETDYRPKRWTNFREEYRFTGKEDDIEVGLTYFGARYYHPLLGRWISPDPLTIHGLGAEPNPYAFVRGSPLRFVDPRGLQPECDNSNCDPDSSSTDSTDSNDNNLPTPFTTAGPSPPSPGGEGVEHVAPPPPPPPRAAAATGVMTSSAGSVWTDPSETFTKWNPNASRPGEAMLLGGPAGIDPVDSFFRANPELKTAAQIAVGGAAVVGAAVVLPTAMIIVEDAGWSVVAQAFPNSAQAIVGISAAGIAGGGVAVIASEVEDNPAVAAGINTGSNVVYQSVAAGTTNYIGITNDLERRAAEQLNGPNGITISAIPGLSNLSRVDARAVEQVLIESFGLGKNGGSLLNKINSISAGNPIYQDAIERGTEILKSLGYTGF